MEGGIIGRILAPDFLPIDGDLANFALVHIREELREIDLFVLLGIAAGADDLPEQDRGDHDHRPKEHRLGC